MYVCRSNWLTHVLRKDSFGRHFDGNVGDDLAMLPHMDVHNLSNTSNKLSVKKSQAGFICSNHGFMKH